MRCISMQALWALDPPSHKVTALLALQHPLSIWSGGEDGAIVRWGFSSRPPDPDSPQQEFWPAAMLCGHTAAIVGLEVCSLDRHVNAVVNNSQGATESIVISLSVDGGVCTWDVVTGRCMHRKQLPSWVSYPAALCSFAGNNSCVAISYSAEFSSASEHGPPLDGNDYEGDDTGSVAAEFRNQSRLHWKGGVIILDTMTLAVLQVVFHGPLASGPIHTIRIVPDLRSEQYTLLLADLCGRIKLWSNFKLDQFGHGKLAPDLDYIVSMSSSSIKAISFSFDGRLMLVVFDSHWEILSTEDGISRIKGPCIDKHESDDVTKDNRFYIGGLFVKNWDPSLCKDMSIYYYTVWDQRGGAQICYLSYTGQASSSYMSYCIPPVLDTYIQSHFCQVGNLLVRFECPQEFSGVGETILNCWDISALISPLENVKHCPFLGKGFLWDDWLHSSCTSEVKPAKHERKLEPTRIITAAIFLPGYPSFPPVLVYGYASGDIKLLDLEATISGCSVVENGGKFREFSWHRHPILCLAVHQKNVTKCAHGVGKVLLSGSMDCCVSVWDINGGCLLAILRQHVSPVRQFYLPPIGAYEPWSLCFISVSEDACMALVSLETLKAERIFPQMGTVKQVTWDAARNYIACLCSQPMEHPGNSDTLYIWDVHSGAQERCLHGVAATSFFKYFSGRTKAKLKPGETDIMPPIVLEEGRTHDHAPQKIDNFASADASVVSSTTSSIDANQEKVIGSLEKISVKVLQVFNSLPNTVPSKASPASYRLKNGQFEMHQPIRGGSLFPNVAAVQFDVFALMNLDIKDIALQKAANTKSPLQTSNIGFEAPLKDSLGTCVGDDQPTNDTVERRLLRMCLSILHIWGIDNELDKSLMDELGSFQPACCHMGVGLPGNRGAATLMFPSHRATFELWMSSSEFCAMRSLMMVSLAQRFIKLAKPGSLTCSALAAFYSRGILDKRNGNVRPSLEVYICFWQDVNEHVRLAARTLFHCAAPRAIPDILCIKKASSSTGLLDSNAIINTCWSGRISSEVEEWIESSQWQEWIGGSNQDAKAARILTCGALVLWYPTLIRPGLECIVAPSLLKLVRAANDKHCATAAEILAEGMESIWQSLIADEIPHFIVDVFSLIECVSGGQITMAQETAMVIRESLAGNLLPSLAVADMAAFLHVVQTQLQTSSAGSNVHLVALMALLRAIKAAPKALIPFLDKAVSFILQAMDTRNPLLSKHCSSIALAAIREMARVFPMVALYRGSGSSVAKLAVADAIGDVHSLTIQVYDLKTVTKLKILDASGPPSHPALLRNGASKLTEGISVLSFSPDGEGLVAFSHEGLIMRWWSLGGAWWEKLSRNLVPVQCTKLVFVPGFSPRSSNTSIITRLEGLNEESPCKKPPDEKLLVQHMDLSFRLEWKSARTVALLRRGEELTSFQL